MTIPCSRYAYDIETFKNFFSVIFVNVDDQEDTHTFVKFGPRDDLDLLKQFILSQELTLIGYNNYRFDNIILNFILKNTQVSTEKINDLAWCIIDNIYGRYDTYQLRRDCPYKSIDLMKLMAFDKMGVGLKQTGINLRQPNIIEFSFESDCINVDQIGEVLTYNHNDVITTIALWKELVRLEEIQLRESISKIYGVSLYDESRSGIANQILNMMYSKETGLRFEDFQGLRTNREIVHVKYCISPLIKFTSSTLKELYDDLYSLKLFKKTKFAFKREVNYGGNIFDIGVGGLHSRDEPGIFRSDKDNLVIDADVSSFYPYIMLNNKIKPKHLSNKFLDIFRQMTEDRIKAKKKGDKAKADVLKITINSIFGKLGFDNFWLYDPQSFYSVTISGQLFLLMLVEFLTLKGFKVVSANTDGVVTIVPRSKEEEYYQVCREWEEQTKFSLEYTKYAKYARRDVNNYICVTPEGKVKEKGVFETSEVEISKTSDYLYKGYKNPIISKALRAYFIHKIPVEEFLSQSFNIYDFLSSQKISKKFNLFYRYVKNGEVIEEPIQNSSRFYVSLQGGNILKKDGNKAISLCGEYLVVVLNRVNGGQFEDYQVDVSYYKKEIQKIISKIEYSNKLKPVSLF